MFCWLGNLRLVGDPAVKAPILERCEAKLAQLRAANSDGSFFPYEIESSPTEDSANRGGLLDSHPNLEFNSQFDERLVRLSIDGWVPRRLPRIRPPPVPLPSPPKWSQPRSDDEEDSFLPRPSRRRWTRSWSDDEYDLSSDDHLEELEVEELALMEERLALKTKLESKAASAVVVPNGVDRTSESEGANETESGVPDVPSAGDLIDEISDGIRLKYLDEQLDNLKGRIKRAQKSIKAKALKGSRRSRGDSYNRKLTGSNIKTEKPDVRDVKIEKNSIKVENIKKEKITKLEKVDPKPEKIVTEEKEIKSRSVKRKSRSDSPRNNKRSRRSADTKDGKSRARRSSSRVRKGRRSKSREHQRNGVRAKSREREVSDRVRSKSRERSKDAVRSRSKSGKSPDGRGVRSRSKTRKSPDGGVSVRSRSKSRKSPEGGVNVRSRSRERPVKIRGRSSSRERRPLVRDKVRSRSKERGNTGHKGPRSRSRSKERIAKKRPGDKVSPGRRKTVDTVSKRISNPEIMEKVRKELEEREMRTKELESRIGETDQFVSNSGLRPSGPVLPAGYPRPSLVQFDTTPRPSLTAQPTTVSSYQPYNRFPEQNAQCNFNYYAGAPLVRCPRTTVASDLTPSPTEDPDDSVLEEAEKKLDVAFQKIPLAFPPIIHIQRDNTPLRLLIQSLEEKSKIINRGPDFNRIFILKDEVLCVMEGNSGAFKIVVPFDKGRPMIQEVHRAYHELTLTELEKLFINSFTSIKELMTELNLVLWDCAMCSSKNLLSNVTEFAKDVTATMKKISNILPLVTLIQIDDEVLRKTIDKLSGESASPDDDPPPGECVFKNGLLWRISQVGDKKTVKIVLPDGKIHSVVKQVHASYHKVSFQELEKLLPDVFDNVENARGEVSSVRFACPECCLKDDWDICSESEKAFMMKLLNESLSRISKVIPFLSRAQREQETLATVLTALASSKDEFKDSYTVKNNVLCQIIQEEVWLLKIVVPDGVERPLVQEMHKCYHDLSDKALEEILANDFHKITDPQIEVNYARFVCETCQREKKVKERCRARRERDEKLANVMNKLSFDEKRRMETKLEKFMKKTERILSTVQEAQRHDRQLFDIISSLNGTPWGIIMMKNDVLCQVVDSTTLQLKIVIPKSSENTVVKRFHEYYHDISDRKAIKILKKGFYKINKIEDKLKSVREACHLCKGATTPVATTEEDSKSDVEPTKSLEESNWIELDAVEVDGDSDGDLYLSHPDSNAFYGLQK